MSELDRVSDSLTSHSLTSQTRLASHPETTSVWHHKPWWCQPWSILLTGISLIAGSWLWLHLWWLTSLVAIPVLAWMGFFLLLYPRLVVQAWEAVGETGDGGSRE